LISSELTESKSCSFVDRDMFMRHFGHGIGHLQYDQQHEFKPDRALEDVADSESSDSDDPDSVTGELDADEPHCNDQDVVGSDEEEEYDRMIIDEEGGASDVISSDSDSDMEGSSGDSEGYASY
jgi:hypothetical protein